MDRILERAEQFSETGYTEFSRWELKTWFGQDRITKTIWRTLLDHFNDKSPNKMPLAIEVSEKFVVIDQHSAFLLSEQ